MTKFFICRHCGNLVEAVHNSGVPMMCCGEKMQALEPNPVEVRGEKHRPVAKSENGVLTVNVGSVDHPMVEEHLIQWIFVETENGGLRKDLKAGDKPAAVFHLGEEKPVAVYAYCNLHGLWMTSL